MNIDLKHGYRLISGDDTNHFLLQVRGVIFFWRWTTLLEWFVVGNTTITFDRMEKSNKVTT